MAVLDEDIWSKSNWESTFNEAVTTDGLLTENAHVSGDEAGSADRFGNRVVLPDL